MNAIELLLEQHQEMEREFARVLEVEEPAQRRLRFRKLADLLTLHIESEEQVFYPAVKARRIEDILLESLEEHLSLKRLVADLNELEPDDQTFEPKFKVLKEQAEHHHDEEEEHLFPKVRKLFPGDRLEALGDEMCTLQRNLARTGEPARELLADQTDAAAPLK